MCNYTVIQPYNYTSIVVYKTCICNSVYSYSYIYMIVNTVYNYIVIYTTVAIELNSI